MRYLTACLVFKDSASYLDEWLRFHLLVGIEHFYLYDNDSHDDFRMVIRPFVEKGQITLFHWPGAGEQHNVYQHCLEENRGNSRWIAFLDDDEFLFPRAGNSLSESLREYEEFAGVAVCWLLFGSNGYLSRPKGLVTRNYRRRAAWVDPHVKCIVNPAKVTGPAVGAHAFHCLPGETIVEEKGRPTSGAFAEQPSAEVFCLNHYLIKSHQELIERRSRPKIDGAMSPHSIEQWKLFDASYNAVEDLRIQRFATSLERKAWRQNLTAAFSGGRQR